MSYERHNFLRFEKVSNVRYGADAPYRHALSRPSQNLSDSQKRAMIASLKLVLRKQVERIARVWVSETLYLSSPSAIKRHPNFRKLLDTKNITTKYCLERLSIPQHRLHWILLLKELTGEDPVPEYSRGIIEEMSAAWLRWGSEKGFI